MLVLPGREELDNAGGPVLVLGPDVPVNVGRARGPELARVLGTRVPVAPAAKIPQVPDDGGLLGAPVAAGHALVALALVGVILVRGRSLVP